MQKPYIYIENSVLYCRHEELVPIHGCGAQPEALSDPEYM
jgi:hypothetical protein